MDPTCNADIDTQEQWNDVEATTDNSMLISIYHFTVRIMPLTMSCPYCDACHVGMLPVQARKMLQLQELGLAPIEEES